MSGKTFRRVLCSIFTWMLISASFGITACFAAEPEILKGATEGDCGATSSDKLTWRYEYVNYKGILYIECASDEGNMMIYNSADEVPWIEYRDKIEKIYVGKGVRMIGDYAFADCKKLTFVSLPKSLQIIGKYAFSGSSLNRIFIPRNVSDVREGAFKDCTLLKGICFFGNGVNNPLAIGKNAFNGCNKLGYFSAPNYIQNIGDSAFTGVPAFTLYVPEGDVYYGNDKGSSAIKRAISDCGGQEVSSTVTGRRGFIEDYSDGYTVEFTVSYSPERKVELTGSGYMQDLEDETCYPWYGENIEILTGTKTIAIGDFAFRDMTSLKSIEITGSLLRTVGESAFKGCTGLNKINLTLNSNVLSTIKTSAFEGCINAKSLSLSSGASAGAKAEEAAFRNCSGIETITITNISITGTECFKGCTSLENLSLNNSGSWHIPEKTFEGCTGMKTLELKSVGNIGKYAFKDCTGLETATLTSVGDVGVAAFVGCSSLKNLTISKANNLSATAFRDCTSLETVVLGNISTLKNAAEGCAFAGCTALRSLDTGNTKTIDGLDGCTSLQELTIGSGTTSIKIPITNTPDTLKTIKVAEGNTVYSASEDGKFLMKDDGKTLIAGIAGDNIPETVTKIDNYAFTGLSQLSSVNIPSNVTEISHYVFKDCLGLKLLSLHKTLNKIGIAAFFNCSNLKTVEYFGSEKEKENLSIANNRNNYLMDANWIYYSGTLFNDGANNLSWEYDGKGVLTFIVESGSPDTIPDFKKPEDAPWYLRSKEITTIEGDFITKAGNYCFYGMSKLTDSGLFHFGKDPGLTAVGDHAFEGCSLLTVVPNAAGITTVGKYAFAGCTKIENADLALATDIGDHAFEGCGAITSAALPAATTIGANAFEDCTSLASADFSAAVDIGDYAFAGCPLGTTSTFTFNNAAGSIGSHAFEGCEGLTAVTVTAVKTIGDNAFSGCENLNSITLPGNAESIGNGILGNCPKLTEIIVNNSGPDDKYSGNDYHNILLKKIGDSSFAILAVCPGVDTLDLSGLGITEIGNDALSGCGKLETIILPDSVEKIGDSAFSGCEKLTSINIPEKVNSIGSAIFDGCKNLTTVTVNDKNTNYRSENNAIIEKSSNTLIAGCNGTTEIPSGIKAIGEGAFKNCTAVAFKSIPEGVTEIGDYAFCGCTGLTEMGIPGSVERIGIAAFGDCTSLKTAVIPSGTKTIDKEAFSNCVELSDEIDLSNALNIGDSAFEGCKKITKAKLPASKKPEAGEPYTLGKAIFKDCTGIEVIDLPEGLQYIPDETFSGCTGIKGNASEGQLIFPEGLLSIGKSAFKGVASIKTIYLPESIELIDTDAFALTSPEEAEYPGNAETWSMITVNSGNDPLLSVLKTGYVPTIYPYEISIDPKDAAITLLETVKLTAAFSPSNTTERFKVISWTSSKPDIAVVDSNGLVTPKKFGMTEITVQTTSDEFETLTGTAKIEVIPLEFTVTYKPGYEGLYSDRQETKSEGSVINLNPYRFDREGYVLSGWKDQDGKTYEKDQTGIVVKGDITFTAQWEADTAETPEDNKERPAEVKKDDPAQHIEKTFALTDSNGSEINVSMHVDMAKTISYNGCKHVPEGGKANKSTLADVKFSLSGNILDYAVIKKITVKNNKNASTDGAKVIVNLKAKGNDKKIKKSISDINKKLKAEPLSFEIIPLDLSTARDSLKVKTNSKKTKVSKLIYSVPGGKDITLPKKSYSVDSIGDGSVTISGKDNCSGSVTLPF